MQNIFLTKLKSDFLSLSVEYLKGVGPQKAEVLKTELNVFTYGDLLRIYPNRHIDKTNKVEIKDLIDPSQSVLLIGKISHQKMVGTGTSKRLTAICSDGTGFIELVWFRNFNGIAKILKDGATYRVYGKPNEFMGKLSLPHPEIKLYNQEEEAIAPALEPIYPLTEKLKARFMDSRYLTGLIKQILYHPDFDIPEFIPDSVLKPLRLIGRKAAFHHVHLPVDESARLAAIKRLKFEEMFSFSMRAEKNKQNRVRFNKGFEIRKTGELVNTFYHQYLTFELTGAQKRVIKEIRADMSKGRQMNRLVQGDVGSGKTVVALFSMLLCKDNGLQSCMMAPTEILATQHYLTLKDMLAGLPVSIELLTGSTKKKERERILTSLSAGETDILIGTHALIEDDVNFSQLALTVIDEQHKFGVAQRAKLWNRYETKPHVLVMTATPIPRTLAMTVHGELDVSVIDELPKDRKPVRTVQREGRERPQVMSFIKEEIKKGRQVYIVYPLIEESGKLDLRDLMSGYDQVCSYFPVPQYQISLLHGKMKPDVKDFEMHRFKDGVTQIMISTTVIEVGVNVPNASVMVIENANRFGLSQLHQLRGRVGRGAEQSYCILMTEDNLNYPSKKRLQTMCSTNNGFEIAQVDLELRGPGDLLGTRQSGLPDFKLLDLIKDEETIDLSKRAAAYILKNDPELKLEENQALLTYLRKHQQDHFWGQVS